MYKIGEFVVYGNEGVCEIENISELDIPGINKNKDYYILKPMHENGMVYAPVDTSVFMRPIITSDEIQNIINEVPYIDELDCNLKNAKMLQDHYKKLLSTHQCVDLLTLVLSINEKQAELAKNGKKLGQIEERYLKAAKSLLEDEFSLALNIPKEEVEAYVYNQINI